MVGMPVFIDQGDVLRRMTDAGIGVGVSKSATGEELYRAILEVRDNPVYKQNINKLSRVFRDKRCTSFNFMHYTNKLENKYVATFFIGLEHDLRSPIG